MQSHVITPGTHILYLQSLFVGAFGLQGIPSPLPVLAKNWTAESVGAGPRGSTVGDLQYKISIAPLAPSWAW